MKNKKNYILYGLLLLVIATLIFSISSLFSFQKSNLNQSMQNTRMSRMSLTSFDTQLARQFMDKDNDGRCDACGMPVDMCIDSGQLQCNMDPTSTIGILGSAHIHADFKVYINEKLIDFASQNYYMKSSFMHVDNNQNKQDASGVLHMHATGVPLWIFFKSVGINTTNLNLYVNGKLNPEGINYVFNDEDKLLLTDAIDEATINKQFESITNYAKAH